MTYKLDSFVNKVKDLEQRCVREKERRFPDSPVHFNLPLISPEGSKAETHFVLTQCTVEDDPRGNKTYNRFIFELSDKLPIDEILCETEGEILAALSKIEERVKDHLSSYEQRFKDTARQVADEWAGIRGEPQRINQEILKAAKQTGSKALIDDLVGHMESSEDGLSWKKKSRRDDGQTLTTVIEWTLPTLDVRHLLRLPDFSIQLVRESRTPDDTGTGKVLLDFAAKFDTGTSARTPMDLSKGALLLSKGLQYSIKHLLPEGRSYTRRVEKEMSGAAENGAKEIEVSHFYGYFPPDLENSLFEDDTYSGSFTTQHGEQVSMRVRWEGLNEQQDGLQKRDLAAKSHYREGVRSICTVQ